MFFSSFFTFPLCSLMLALGPHFGASWLPLGANLGPLTSPLAPLGLPFESLGLPSWALGPLLGRSWGALGPFLVILACLKGGSFKAAARQRMKDFNSQELVNTAWAFATVAHKDEELFTSLAGAA